MRTGRNTIMLIMLLLVFCAFLSGCVAEETPYASAVRLFGEGKYTEAEPFFITALDMDADNATLRLGHAYNLIELDKKSNAIDELIAVQDYFPDETVKISIRKTLIDLYLTQNNMAGAARVYEELSRITTDPSAEDAYLAEASLIRADIYREKGDEEKLKKELRKLITVKTFADNEYYELYSLSCAAGEKTDRLALADEIIGYMTGHSSYISEYGGLLSVIFDAADVASYTEWTKKSEDYFVTAEDIISKAEGAGITENQALKYKVIIAERRGKTEVAYKLLGVYLNHCPDDEYALKEMDYLGNRLGLAE